MKKFIKVVYLALSRETLIELDDSHNPKTVKAILENLPIKVIINKWGEELYTDKTPITVNEENPTKQVNLFDVVYWPPGQAICLFYGPTPISKPNRILAYSQVSVVGRIIPDLDEKCKVLEKIHDKTMVFIKKIN